LVSSSLSGTVAAAQGFPSDGFGSEGTSCPSASRGLQIREEREGRRLTPEGASGYEFFVIEEGTADVIHEGANVGSLGPGDFFGEMAMMGDGRRVADVVATSPITLFEMFGTHFRELEMTLPETAARIRATLEERRAAL
jgi:CRP-like cAMP-binding protein